MGVRRITSLIQNQGWIPTTSTEAEVDSTCRLWREWDPSLALSHHGLPIQPIPTKSSILIDGNGLAFFLFRVAYARYLKSLFAERITGTFPAVKSLDSPELTQALPCMMPLNLLEDVACEFLSHLRWCNLEVQIFWDGPNRRFKTVTTRRRMEQRRQELANLQQYCVHGSLPDEKSIYGFLRQFPVPSLFLQSVRKALYQANAAMVYCEEEADVELARVACGDSNAFVLGQDSDFYFYKDIQYVSFDCIFSASDAIYGCIGKRQDLAMLLEIEDEDMTELAILLGNDYVQSVKVPKKKDIDPRDPIYVASYINEQEDGFLVSSNKHSMELSFVRALYNLEDLDSFPLHQDLSDLGQIESDEVEEIIKHLKIQLPTDLAEEASRALEEGLAFCETVERCLSFCTQSRDDDEPTILGLEHVGAYSELTSPQTSKSTCQLDRPPQWANVQAAYAIEKCISIILKTPRASLLVQSTPISVQFSHYKFNCILASKESNEVSEEKPVIPIDEKKTDPKIAGDRKALPIDAHEDRIIQNIANNRVTIIHGETGCGKSSRVPVMVLNAPSPEAALPRVKLFISQPRRIAAKGLVERVRRCEPEHRDKFAIRMGHGWKEYETRQTQAWFVTTGYLTRLLAKHPERFDDCTHLIIDEVHERSVDTDILCLLCRRLLGRNKTIRLVLMSATLATKLYKEYFKVPNAPIHVGVRTFPITEYFAEDLSQFKLPPNEMHAIKAIKAECHKKKCSSAPKAAELSKRFSLAAQLAKAVGKPGTSVLIFVPGMNEIVAIAECIDQFHVVGTRYITCPIHSDIPFDEQMEAFNEPGKDEIKIIIATNAAESSVTLPTVDHVICLGLCRQIIYNPDSHRQMLAPMWISQASAKQRAGRTGRVRPGNVYRLYTRESFENFMDEFDIGEISRVPLDSVILMLKEMLHEQVIPVLCNCIEPPNMDTIDRSFESLHRSNFIEESNDEADITCLGSFVSSLGIDLMLGSLIGLGIQFGVAAEAIEMAAMMSFPKTPFQITSPLFHTPAMFNEITAAGYVSKCHFDANLYSESMSLMNALYDYDNIPNKNQWCFNHRIAHARMKQLASTRKSLRTRVAQYFGINDEVLIPESPPVLMPHAKVNILRILQVWVFSDTIVVAWPPKTKNGVVRSSDGSTTLHVRKGEIERSHLDQVLDPERHPCSIVRLAKLRQVGKFGLLEAFDLDTFISTFKEKLVSYMIETNIALALIVPGHGKNSFVLLTNSDSSEECNEIVKTIDSMQMSVTKEDLIAWVDSRMKRRGIFERRCGAWTVAGGNNDEWAPVGDHKRFTSFHVQQCSKENMASLLIQIDGALMLNRIASFLHWSFPPTSKKKKMKTSAATMGEQKFTVEIRGDCSEISNQDLKDLLGAPIIHSMVHDSGITGIHFNQKENQPLAPKKFAKGCFAKTITSTGSSWKRPLLENIPEGARLLGLLAAGQRRAKDTRLRFVKADNKDSSADPDTSDVYLDYWISTSLNTRWDRLGASTGRVLVEPSTVPASAFTLSGPLFACCSNTLEIKGGAIKIEGLSLLPPNPLFLLLSLLTFGLKEKIVGKTTKRIQRIADQDNGQQETIKALLLWFQNFKSRLEAQGIGSEESCFDWDIENAVKKVNEAIAFHNDACGEMGDTLRCFPEMVCSLCSLFSFVDGYEMTVWDSLDDTALSEENLSRWKKDAKSVARSNLKQKRRESRDRITFCSATSTTSEGNTPLREEEERKKKKDKKAKREEKKQKKRDKKKKKKLKLMPQVLTQFDSSVLNASRRWFSTTSDEVLLENDLPSTNILALIHEMYIQASSSSSLGDNMSYSSISSVHSANWLIKTHTKDDGNAVYHACFFSDCISSPNFEGRGELPGWIRNEQQRPSASDDAFHCLPPQIPQPVTTLVTLPDGLPILMYETIELALKMEAAFWLEWHLFTANDVGIRHWYQHSISEMLNTLKNREDSKDQYYELQC